MAETSPLRHRMIEDMQVRNLSPSTQRNYLYAIARLARRHFAVSPADLGPEELRAYLTHLVERRISFSYFNMIVAALRFLYTVTLERDWAVPRYRTRRRHGGCRPCSAPRRSAVFWTPSRTSRCAPC